jgi:hypothetical protein
MKSLGKMRRHLVLMIVLIIGVISIISQHTYAQKRANVFYFGVHYEKGMTLSDRIAWYNSEYGYFITDVALATIVAGVCGWQPPENRHVGDQFKLLSIRASGSIFEGDNHSFYGLDIGLDITQLVAKAPPGSKDNFELHSVYPLYIGPSMYYPIDKHTNIITMVTYGYALAQVDENNNDKTQHKRVAFDVYVHHFLNEDFLLYGSFGIAYFMKGLPKTYPKDESIIGWTFTVGVAF